jgi:hypothetical protein
VDDRNSGGDQAVTKIEFLLMLISVFVCISYIPVRTEANKAVPSRSIRYRRDA